MHPIPEKEPCWRRINTPAAHYEVIDVTDGIVTYHYIPTPQIDLTLPLSEWHATMELLYADDFDIF